MRSSSAIAIFLILAFSFVSQNVHAHDVRPALLSLVETKSESFSVLWKMPVNAAIPLNLTVGMPENCGVVGEKNQWEENNFSISRWEADCPGGLIGGVFTIGGLESSLTDVLVQIEFLENSLFVERLTPEKSTAEVPVAPSRFGVIKSYTLLGVEHILSGIDHLLFVLCIVLLIPYKKKLFLAVTAFTVAHSITLIMTVLGYFSLHSRMVEVLIALSIVLLAYEVLRSGKGKAGLSARYPWLVIFVFGLMHGFGFAGALADIGLPQSNIPAALLFFNVGVEVGQLLFVAVLLVLAIPLRSLAKSLPQWRVIPAYMIGIAGAFWFFQRLLLL